MTDDPAFNLDDYLARVGFDGEREAALSTLEALHVAHLGRIPFENVDVYLGRPGSLDLGSLQARMVRARRGGYCFEQNTLFAAALRSLGFQVATLEARVRPEGATATLPRTHMLLRVSADGRGWLADVGFGGDGPLLPVPLDGALQEQPDGAYRVEQEDDGVHVLTVRRNGRWRDLYAFTLAPALPVDFEVAHHYTSTHPRSRFLLTLTVQRVEPQRRRSLRGLSYTEHTGGTQTTWEISREELPALLRDGFGLDLADDVVRVLLDRIASERNDPARGGAPAPGGTS